MDRKLEDIEPTIQEKIKIRKIFKPILDELTEKVSSIPDLFNKISSLDELSRKIDAIGDNTSINNNYSDINPHIEIKEDININVDYKDGVVSKFENALEKIVSKITFPKSIKVENFKDVQDVVVKNQIKNINIDNLPLSEGFVPNKNKANPSKYLNVRLTNGREFIDIFNNVVSSLGNFPSWVATASNQINGNQKTKITDGAGVVNTKQLGTSLTQADIGLITNSIIHGLSTAGGGTYVDVKVTPSGALTVESNIQPLTSVYNGSKTVPTGTAQAIATTQSISSVTIKALSTNTVSVYIGASGVTTSTGFELSAGESISLDVSDLATVYCISGSASQVVRYIAI